MSTDDCTRKSDGQHKDEKEQIDDMPDGMARPTAGRTGIRLEEMEKLLW